MSIFVALGSQGRGEEITLATARPVVMKSAPEAGADGVDPGTTQSSVTFSKPMQAWHLVMVCLKQRELSRHLGPPKYLEGKRTCVLPVKLQPGKTYAVWINSEKFYEVRDTKGQPAVPHLLALRTRT